MTLSIDIHRSHRFITSIYSWIHPEIPPHVITGLVSVDLGGFCGFRVLAAQIYNDQSRFADFKADVRYHMRKSKRYTSSIFAVVPPSNLHEL